MIGKLLRYFAIIIVGLARLIGVYYGPMPVDIQDELPPLSYFERYYE